MNWTGCGSKNQGSLIYQAALVWEGPRRGRGYGKLKSTVSKADCCYTRTCNQRFNFLREMRKLHVVCAQKFLVVQMVATVSSSPRCRTTLVRPNEASVPAKCGPKVPVCDLRFTTYSHHVQQSTVQALLSVLPEDVPVAADLDASWQCMSTFSTKFFVYLHVWTC